MVPSIPPGAPSLVALGAKQLAAFLRRNEVKNLLKAVAADVAQTPGVAPDKVNEVRGMISALGVDPEVMGGLKRLLDAGDTTATPLIQKRLEEILVPEDPALASLALPAVTAHSFEVNVSLAKRDEKGVSRVEGQLTRSVVKEQMDDLRREMQSGFGDLRASAAVPARKTIPDFGFSNGVTRILGDLEKADPSSATHLATALEAGGTARALELIDGEQQWMQAGGAELWVALGKLADRRGSFGKAESAYLKAAEMPDVSDRVRQLVRASGSARLGGDLARSDELLAQATAIDSKNPALAIAAARNTDDPAEILELLDGIDPVDDDQAVLLELTRAGAESAARQFEQARAHVEAARQLLPDSPMVREVSANVVLLEAQAGWPDEAPINRGELSRAAIELFALGRELSEDRPGAGAVLLARASQAFSIAEDFQAGNDALDEALAVEGRGENDAAIADAALLLKRFDLVDSLDLGEGEEGRLTRAISHVLGERDVRSAAEDLDCLMESDDQAIATRAAFIRLGASSPVHDVSWSEEAAEIVGNESPEVVAVLKAEFLAEDDHVAEAEQALSQFSSSAAPLRRLVGLAVRREDYEAAARLSDELISRYGEARDRLNHAGLLARQGDKATARDRFLMLARDTTLPADVRSQAYGRATSLVMEASDLVELQRLSEEWRSFAPKEEDPVWLHIFALARRRHHSEAFAFWREHELEVRELRQALLLSEVYGFGTDPPESLREIAALSDLFDRPEDLEYNLMMTALRTEGEDRTGIGEDLERRIKQTFADFTERFPDSTRMQAYKVDEDDPSGFLDTIRPQLEARAKVSEALFEEVRKGSGATHLLAAATGRSIGEIWANLPALPLGYSDQSISSEERLAAADAIAKRAAVWDPTSIYVVGGVGEARAQTLRNVLPASLIAESTFEDVSSDLRKPVDGQGGYISYDPGVGGLVMGETSAIKREFEERRAKGMAEMASGFTIRMDLLPEERKELEKKLEQEIEELTVAGRTWPATLAIARREELAVFSDDRFVRLAARQAGIPTFGTLALLDVLVEQGSITEADRVSARRRIYCSGAWGMEIGCEELIDRVREDEFELTNGIRAVLNDFLAWPARGIESVEIALALLNAVHAECPESFATWVHLVVDSLSHTLGGGYERWTRFLISAALNPLRDPPCLSVPAVQALIDALRGLDYFQHFPPRSDFVLDAINEALSFADDDRARAWYFRLLIDLLGPRDRAAAIATFVRPPDP
jgi:tetratricopeptide (TPR) repeat protein/predicted nucleic acid-binding protein